MNNMHSLIWIGLFLIFLGVIVLIVGSIFSIFQREYSGGGGEEGEETKITTEEVKGGGIIFIGPIPLVFGTDKESILFLSILMLILMLLSYVLFFR
jgi:uncharacterized protein (TIGR00304 family)